MEPLITTHMNCKWRASNRALNSPEKSKWAVGRIRERSALSGQVGSTKCTELFE